MQSQTTKIIIIGFIITIVIGGIIFYSNIKKIIPNTITKENIEKEDIIFDQKSKDYAIMSREFWSAIECSTWASHFDDQKEAERLFTFGYEQGKKFLGAVRAEKISEEDWRTEIPMGISMRLEGPNDDFILGVISADIQESALEEVFYTNYNKTKLNSDDLQKSIAENKYRDGNCQLIGK